MNLLYIDYKDLYNHKDLKNSLKKRILFLKTIWDLSYKDSTKLYEIDINNEDLNCFIEVLNSPKFRKFFITFDDRIDLSSKIDGKIFVGMDSFLKDLNQLKEQYQKKSSIKELSEILKESGKINNFDLKIYFENLTPILFRLWLFKYINTPFIPHSIEGINLYKISLKKLKGNQLKEIFNIDYLIYQIKKLPERKIKGELDNQDIKNIKIFLDEIFHYIGDLNPKISKDYWFNLSYTVRIALNKLDVENKEHHKFLEKKLFLFLVLEGNKNLNSRNPIISRYEGKIVLFNDSISLTKKLNPGDIVLGEILFDKPKYIPVNVLKKMNKKEANYYLEKGLKCAPSKKQILKRLEN
jgi:Fe-S cluster biosynthesis and repair protein YggX